MSLPEARNASGSVTDASGECSQMSSRRSVVAGIAAAMLVAPLVSACGSGGFRPMYADLNGTGGLSEKLAQIEISPIPGRVGQQLRNELIFEARGGGNPLPPEYRLEIAIRENIVSTLTERTGDSRGQVYNLDASFRLISLKDKEVILSGTSYGRAGFERYDSIFSNVRARRDAEDRAATTVGMDLKSRLSAFLATKA